MMDAHPRIRRVLASLMESEASKSNSSIVALDKDNDNNDDQGRCRRLDRLMGERLHMTLRTHLLARCGSKTIAAEVIGPAADAMVWTNPKEEKI